MPVLLPGVGRGTLLRITPCAYSRQACLLKRLLLRKSLRWGITRRRVTPASNAPARQCSGVMLAQGFRVAASTRLFSPMIIEVHAWFVKPVRAYYLGEHLPNTTQAHARVR